MKTETIKNLIQFGNTKLPKSTMIFNMGTAAKCPSKELGLCSVAGCCYAGKAETHYAKHVPAYRERQATYWLANDATTIIEDMGRMLGRKRKLPTLFRFNEAGDFYSQECVTKLSLIASFLKEEFGIMTYGYTARRDFDFSKASFLVKGSDNDAGNNGRTTVVDSESDIPADFIKCKGSCKTCSLCSSDIGFNIAFIRH